MSETMPALPWLSPVHGKRIVARFDGGQLSFDDGILALREIEKGLGISDRLAASVTDPRDPQRVTHSIADIMRFRMLMIPPGQEDTCRFLAVFMDIRRMSGLVGKTVSGVPWRAIWGHDTRHDLVLQTP
jgi:hypothetical protein